MEKLVKSDLLTDIVGTWKLISWIYKDENGKDVKYFDDNPMGILMYDGKGYMSVQIHKPNRAEFSSEHLFGGSPEDITSGFKSYLAYYGRYHQEEPDIITHTVEGSLFPNWENNFQKRHAEIDGDHLILSTPPLHVGSNTTMNFTLTWVRFNG